MSPQNNAALVANDLNRWGELQNAVEVEVAFEDLDRVDVVVAGQTLTTLFTSHVLSEIVLPAIGSIDIEFIGYKNGAPAIVQTRTVFVNEPTNLSCPEFLNLYQVAWEEAAASPGIHSPISLSLPLNGLNYRFVDIDTKRNSLYLDCELALALVRANPIFLKNGISTIVDLGIYNYRCIGGEGFPPDCPQGISAHANGQAIDIYALENDGGQVYSIENDWVIDEENVETCSADTENASDALLHKIFCDQSEQGIWNTILTPNFNSAHRNHVHLDLKEGNDFTRSKKH